MGFISVLSKVLNGLTANDGTGQTLRSGADTINANWNVIASAVNALAASQGSGVKPFATKADLVAEQSTLPSGTVAVVYDDPTPSNNTSYIWDGSTLATAYDRLTYALGNGSGFEQIGSGSVLRTVQDKLRERFTPLDYAASIGPDQTQQVQAVIAKAWAARGDRTTFNGAASSDNFVIDFAGRVYGVSSTIQIGLAADGVAAGGGDIIIKNGGLVALSGFASGAPLLKIAASDGTSWIENFVIEDFIVDCAYNADVGIQTNHVMRGAIDKCHVLRFNTTGIDLQSPSYNVGVIDSIVEWKPYGETAPTGKTNPTYGVKINSTDSYATGTVVIGCVNGMQYNGKTRIRGCHLYGNLYSIVGSTQFLFATNNYIEGPMLLTGGRDCSIVGNFFSDGIAGAGIIFDYDGSGSSGGATSVIGNVMPSISHGAAANLTLSAASGDSITVTADAAVFGAWPATSQVPVGAIITETGGTGVAAIRAVASSTSATIDIISDFTSTSLASGAWTMTTSLITCTGSSNNFAGYLIGNDTPNGRSVNGSTTEHVRLGKNDRVALGTVTAGAFPKSQLAIGLVGNYGPGVGDGKGDLSLTNGTYGLHAGVATVGGSPGDCYIWAAGGTEQLILASAAHGVYLNLNSTRIGPGSDNTISLGTAGNRFSTVYAGTGSINTSDARDKTQVTALSGAELEASKALAQEIGTYQWLTAIQAKGSNARLHIGLTVQRAIEIMHNHGLDPMRYGFICYDEWEAVEPVEIKDEEGNVVHTQPGTPAGNCYGLRSDELLLFIARGFDARLKALESPATT